MGEAVLFDTYRFVKRMTAAGLQEAVAEALADEQVQLLERNLATKADLAAFQSAIKADITATQADLAAFQSATKADIAATNERIEQLRQETAKLIAECKTEIIKWNVGTMLGFAAIVLTTVKFL